MAQRFAELFEEKGMESKAIRQMETEAVGQGDMTFNAIKIALGRMGIIKGREKGSCDPKKDKKPSMAECAIEDPCSVKGGPGVWFNTALTLIDDAIEWGEKAGWDDSPISKKFIRKQLRERLERL
jgi:hypothetical protein